MFASTFWKFITDRPLFTLGIAFVLAAHGAVRFYLASTTRSKEKAAASWPQVMGTVHFSFVGTQHVATGSSSRSSTETRHAPRVSYTYDVDGKEFKSTRIGFGNYSRRSADAGRKVAERYPKGADVSVHYNPAKPSEAVLELSSSNTNSTYALSLLTLAVSAALFVVWIVQIAT